MFKTISRVQGLIKSCNRLLSSLTTERLVAGHVDTQKKVVYGGNVWAPTHRSSFGSLLFSRLTKLPKEDLLQVCVSTKKKLTAENFLRKGVAVARKLQEKGISKGDIVVLMGDNSLNMNIAAAGTFFLGAVPAPISTKTKLGEIKILLKSVRPKVVFIDGSFLLELKNALDDGSLSQTSKVFLLSEKMIRTLPASGIGNLCWNNSEIPTDETDVDTESFNEFIKDAEHDVDSFKPAEVEDTENELALLMVPLTEGPMGRLVGVTHHNLNSLIARFDSSNTSILSKHVILMGQKMACVSGVYCFVTSCCYGAQLLVMKDFVEEEFMEAIEEHKATVSILIIVKLWMLFKHEYTREYDLSSFKYILSMDGPLPQSLVLGMKEKFGITLRDSYGVSELTGLVLQSLAPTKPGSTGSLTLGTYGKVISEKTNHRVGPNELGIICFKGPTLTKGYINDNKSTHQLLDKEGFLVSEMFGYYDEDGFFFVVDKLRNVIKYKDCDVSSRGLEGIIKILDDVRDVAVAGIQHPTDGYWPIAFVVLRPKSKLTAQEIIEHVEGSVEDCKRLRAGVIFVRKIPRSKETGSIRRYLIDKVLSKYRIPADMPPVGSANSKSKHVKAGKK